MATRKDNTVSAPIAHSVDDFCTAIGIGRTKLYDAIRTGELPTLKVGKRRLILAEEGHAWLLRHRALCEAPK
jgi:excisionase family DNA binding protein